MIPIQAYSGAYGFFQPASPQIAVVKDTTLTDTKAPTQNTTGPCGANPEITDACARPHMGLVRQIVAITFFRLVLNTARRFVYPFAPALSRELNVPLAAITTLIALNHTSGLLGLASGPLADRWGYRNVMRLGLAMLVAGMVLCMVAPVYRYVLIGLLLAGLGKNVFDPALQAFIGRQVPFARRGLAIGAIETAWAGSTFIGIPAIALIIDQFGLRWSFLAMALFGAWGFLFLSRMIPADNRSAAGTEVIGIMAVLKQLIRIRPAVGMMGFAFWMSMANDNLFVVYGAWLERDFGISLLALGLSTGIIGAAELLGEFCTAIWADRIGIKRAMVIGMIMVFASYAALPFISGSIKTALIGLFLIFAAFEFTMVCSFSLSTELMPASRATMMAGFFAAAAIGHMVGALSGTPVWSAGGLGAVAVTSAAGTLFAILSFWWGLRHWKR